PGDNAPQVARQGPALLGVLFVRFKTLNELDQPPALRGRQAPASFQPDLELLLHFWRGRDGADDRGRGIGSSVAGSSEHGRLLESERRGDTSEVLAGRLCFVVEPVGYRRLVDANQ